MKTASAALALALAAATAASAQTVAPEQAIRENAVLAEETFLAGGALRGRGSATADEAIAAAYVASQFAGFGLKPAPGMTGYVQAAPVVRHRLTGTTTLTIEGQPVAGVSLIMSQGGTASGTLAAIADATAPIPDGTAVLLYTGPLMQKMSVLWRAARGKGVKLIIVPQSAESQAMTAMVGPASAPALEDAPPRPALSVVAVPADAIARLKPGVAVTFDAPFTIDKGVTSNAIGYLPGTDPKAGVILLSAHLDHLGVRADGVEMPGANDDASGTVAVIELARAFAAAGPMRRGILFVAYGAEVAGGLGSRYFGAHPPVPLTDLVANIEFEMIGAQDPRLPKGALMMTGSERSTLYDMMKAQGAMIAPDPYPTENFFQRSDNYSLALRGIVAHTFSGWAVVPTYHQPTDTVANIDIPFMTAAIRSLVKPIALLAGGTVKPEWKPGGQPRP